MSSLILAGKVGTAVLSGLAGVGQGEDSFLVQGGEVLYPNYCGHSAEFTCRACPWAVQAALC